MRVGLNPRKKPRAPSFSKIFLAIAMGCPAAADSSPTAAEEDWSWVLMTSRGLVMQEAIVPAAPPERRLNSFIRPAVIVRVVAQMAVEDPPRVSVGVVMMHCAGDFLVEAPPPRM